MTERKLATIRMIDQIVPIPDADYVELARVGGWDVVVKKGQFEVGNLAIYIEIDSWVPLKVAPFLAKGKEKTFNGVVGERLRTKKLRGFFSQGLLLDLVADDDCPPPDVDTDLTEYLGIQLYEKPIPTCLAGMAKGNFPPYIKKTDQERIQNLKAKYAQWQEEGTQWEVTEKLDGSSMTVYQHQGTFGVCSRNIDLKQTEGNTFWDVAIRENIHMEMFNKDESWDFAIQGELCGPGIQGNQYNLTKPQFFVYDIFDIQTQEYLLPHDRKVLCEELGLKHVPVIWETAGIKQEMSETLYQAQGESELNGTHREGLVFKSLSNTGESFKVINNEWLLKYD